MSNIPTVPIRWGRAWKVEIITIDGTLYTVDSTTWEPESLHITFDVMTGYLAWWTADVVIYNLNLPEMQNMILFGMTLRLSAGYQSDIIDKCVIFEGTIFQALWERENALTDKLTLHCIIGALEGTNNFVNQTVVAGQGLTQRKLVAQMAKACRQQLNVDIDGVDDDSSNPITRATTFFGQPTEVLEEIARTNNALFWFSQEKANIKKLFVADTVPEIEYNDTNGLIGTAQQIQNGVSLKVLLDSRVKMLTQIKLSPNVIVRQMARTPSQEGEYPSIIDPHGQYGVMRVHHYGDSRGNDWYTEITALTYAAVMLTIRTFV